MYLLYITNPETGVVQVRSFPTAFDRALTMIGLASSPLVLRTAEY